MKLIKLTNILESKKDLLTLEGIRAVYLYGSQIDYMKSNRIVPIGKEVDLIFIKEGFLKDGNSPISNNLAYNIFGGFSNIIIAFNGIWSDCQFIQGRYYLDILGEGIENIKSEHPSCKIVAVKKKINIWGNEIKELNGCSPLNSMDKEYLKQVMSTYIKREFFNKNTLQNRNSILKNSIFLASLYDIEILVAEPREKKLILIKTSIAIPDKIKEIIHSLNTEYEKKNHDGLKKLFTNLMNKIKF